MAHQLTTREDGTVEMAFIGERSNIWHGLGQELQEGLPIEDWVIQAGMNWEVSEAPVLFTGLNGEMTQFADKKALYRSDTGVPLSVVGDKFKVVHPAEVLEFFRDLVSLHDMKLSTAGTLFGGKRFWALAETGDSFNLTGDDEVYGNLLLVTSVDGTLATTAKFTSTRVVCNNTLTVSLGEKRSAIKVSHKADFDATQVKIDMGLIDASWLTFKENVDKLAKFKMTDSQVERYVENLFYDANVAANEQSWGSVRKVEALLDLYKNGAGANIVYGTAWGLVNAVTNGYTHGLNITARKKDSSKVFWDSEAGVGDVMKTNVFNDLLKLAA